MENEEVHETGLSLVSTRGTGLTLVFFWDIQEEEQRKRMIWRHVSQGRLLSGSLIVDAASGTLLKSTNKPTHTAFISLIILQVFLSEKKNIRSHVQEEVTHDC